MITFNEGVRGGRVIQLKATVDAAVKTCPSVQHVFVCQRTETPVVMGERDIQLEEVRSILYRYNLNIELLISV